MSTIKDIPINSIDASENSGESCSASEPFALRMLDTSMSPEFDIDHIVIIDPSITPKNGDFVLYETKSRSNKTNCFMWLDRLFNKMRKIVHFRCL